MTDHRPLAEQLRPSRLDQVVGQQHLLGAAKPLSAAISSGLLHSLLLWGPPGTGKTTLARLLADSSAADFIQLSAVLSGVKDIRLAIEKAQQNRQQFNRSTVLFIDEAHRFNKVQQDLFLPYVENGDIIFVGATTENPSFEVNNALLSRVRVYPLYRLNHQDLLQIIDRVIRLFSDQKETIEVAKPIRDILVETADGDARRLLNLLDLARQIASPENGVIQIDKEVLENILTTSVRQFDNKGDMFYDQISALHKSIRGSSPDASLYWLVRMLDAGCDPLYIARRVVRMASEDIGNADPRALQIALNAWDVVQRLGSPEGELTLAQAVVYLACAAKSNAVYKAYKQVLNDVQNTGSLDVPLHLRNASTKLMREMGVGKGYRYAHDEDQAYAAGEHYFPDGMDAKQYYKPVSRGLEISIGEKLKKLRQLDKQHQT